uniref:MAT1-1-11 protein n=1 Tax=Morchella sextelata TaxID=1174677 RepID=A0A7T7JPU4_9PEZI|nr:MAT1-1-11 protein [Morchella sextelata]
MDAVNCQPAIVANEATIIPRKTTSRREAISQIRNVLCQVKNDLAYKPRAVPDAKVRDVVIFSTRVLRRFRIKELKRASIDERLDFRPIADIYSLGHQVKSLLGAQSNLVRDLGYLEKKIQKLQHNYTEDIWVAVADLHEFLIFACFVNQIHRDDTLDEATLYSAQNHLIDSPHPEAGIAFADLRAARQVEKELQKLSYGEGLPTVSKVIKLGPLATSLATEWYRNYELHMPADGQEWRNLCRFPLPSFETMLGWFENSRRRILSDIHSIRPGLKAIIDKQIRDDSVVTKLNKGISMDEKRGETEKLDTLLADMIHEVDKLGSQLEMKAFTPPQFPPSCTPQNHSPIKLQYWVSDTCTIDGNMKQAQHIIGRIFEAFTGTADFCMNVILRSDRLGGYEEKVFAQKSEKEFNIRYLSAVGEFLGQMRFHKVFEAINPDEFDSEELTPETRDLVLRDRHHSQILTCIFDAFGSLSEAEEEYLLGITHLHMSLEEIHEWFQKHSAKLQRDNPEK